MANKEEAEKLHFNVDLYKQAKYHLQFLKTIENIPELKQTNVLKRAVYRYEKFWLPLAADHTDECLVAPLDIEWVWHCHMLNPEAYERDCQTIVGITINHTLHNQASFIEKQNEARQYWLQKYETQAEPFDIVFTTTNDQHGAPQYASQFKYDIIGAAGRQAVFYYQVSLPHFKDGMFLEHSVLRYKQFLYIKTKVEQDFLVPCYDIDLIWHTHQLNPVVYKDDMVRIIGYLFNHDDNVNDRSEDSKLNMAGKETSENWRTFYGENFSLPGAMYRGTPPQGRLHVVDDLLHLNFDKEYMSVNKICTISLNKLILTMSSGDSNRYRSVKLTGSICKGFLIVKSWLSLTCRFTSSSEAPDSIEMTRVGYYKLDTKTADNIRFEVYGLSGVACCKSETFLGSSTLNVLPIINQRQFAKSGGTIQENITLGNNISLNIEGYFSVLEFEHVSRVQMLLRNNVQIFLERGQYKTVTIPEDVQQLFGPVALESRPEGASNLCQTATHRLKSLSGETMPVEVTVIHSQPLLMSVIQVICNEKMVAVAHLIASDQLPLPTQVSEVNVNLNPKKGERAVLIKNNEGDWGIVIGCWRDFKRGIKGKLSERAVLGNPGQPTARFYKFSSDKIIDIYQYKSSRLAIEGFEVDITGSIIQIDATNKEIAENIALVFSVALLHVLCVPRPEGYVDGQKVEPTGSLFRGDKSVSVVSYDTMPFMIASGLHSNTPSNYYISRTFGNMTCCMCGGREIKCDADMWKKLQGKDGDDPNSTGCGCGGSTSINHKQFSAGLVGAGCGGCGGRKCRSECGSCGGHGKYYMSANTSKSSKGARSGTGHAGTETKSGTGDSSSFAVDHLHISVLDCDSGGCGGGGGDSGGGCDSGFD
ncbi:uncharacterized protein LOC132744229 [Ruditapes philippinarum]|uniref:uncharacterized protein LOC132744229 n=1 Tax=Ruditapes philippinarum TaxID=129788 RepID=UPI00295B1094|nr:uncharacterized protein LOC132744229 [Ruditapes philippinarum]XP_060588855.1 uncharacterized protein LOC132744229 [Ruditapes philippinarum]